MSEAPVDTETQLPFEEESSAVKGDPSLPEGRDSFKPEELFEFTRVKPFVLKYWESEFPALKSRADGADYSREEVALILSIRRLLYDEGLTLEAARKRLSGEKGPKPKATKKTAKKPAKKPGKKPAKKETAQKKTPAKAVKKKSPMKTAPSKPTAAAPQRPKAGGKRGLPGAGAARSRVGLEDLLPDRPAASKPKNAGKADPRALELEGKLSLALRELRGILTFLRKGDR